jgi:ribose 5-phosphate isomerase B
MTPTTKKEHEMSKKVIMVADPFGFPLKKAVKEHLQSEGYEIIDLGTDSPDHFMDYYEVGSKAAKAIQNGVADQAIIFCGSGMGVSLTANKFKGIRAGLCESEFTAEMCKLINNCNILAMGSKVISETRANKAADLWLTREFGEDASEGGKKKRAAALAALAKIEDENFK